MPRMPFADPRSICSTRTHALRSLFIPLMALVLLCAMPTTARADIDAWYVLTSPVGPGTGIASVEQGGPGQRLVLHLEDTTEPISAEIDFHVLIPEADAIYIYGLDLISPIASNVAVTSQDFTALYDLDFPGITNMAPGKILENIGQLTFEGDFVGRGILFHFALEITPPVDSDIDLYSGISLLEWVAASEDIPLIRFADATPLMGHSGSPTVSDTPSIVITLGGGPIVDCNGNKIPDDEEISGDPALDCNGDQVIDTCEITANAALDCNGNNTLDSCEIAADASLDCNNNAALDTCEITANAALDCNGNNTLDSCEIAADASLDCNTNETLDGCEIAAGDAGDCNSNNVPDSCDIAGGGSIDANNNGTPDECEPAPPLPVPAADDDQSATGDPQDNSQTQPHHLIDRNCLRNILRLIFGIPAEGGPTTPLAALTLYGLNFYGIPLAAVQAVMEVISLPVRMFLYEVTYTILDFLLP